MPTSTLPLIITARGPYRSRKRTENAVPTEKTAINAMNGRLPWVAVRPSVSRKGSLNTL